MPSDVVSYALKQQVLDRLKQLILSANAIYKRTFNQPQVVFHLRGTSAGKANLRSNTIYLNHVLLAQNPEEFLTDTVPHELAHLLTHTLYGRAASAHGAEWKSVMRALGAEPSRCHTLDISGIKGMHAYKCACTTHHISTVRHNKVLKGQSYTCPKCRHVLVSVASGKSPYTVSRPATRPATPPSNTRPSLPARNSAPTRPPPGAVRLPSDAMVKYAKDLAKKHRIMLTPEVLASFSSCRDFISRWAAVKA